MKIKRLISALLVAVMILSAAPLSGLTQLDLFSTKAEAASVTGSDIVTYAKTFLGYPYVKNTHGPKTFDCSGLVFYVFNHFGIKLPYSTSGGYKSYGKTISESEAKPGDLVVWGGHVGIYTGGGECINALNPSKGVCYLTIKSFKNSSGVLNPEHWYIRVNGVSASGTVTNAVSQPTCTTSNYVGGVKVTLKCATSGAAIYYTTDGKTPTTSSTKYSSAFNLTSTKTVKAIAVKSGMTNSTVMSKQITVNKVAAPKISSTISSNGFNVSISCESGATVYYTTDGTNPTTSSTKYNGGFIVSSNVTVKAVAVKNGMATSAVAQAALSASVPKAPTVSLDSTTAKTVGVDDKISVKWTKVDNTFEYTVCINDGKSVTYASTQGCVYSFAAKDAGKYKITVKASNFLGESSESTPPVEVEVKPDVKVTFKNYDGTVLSEQSIHYGKSAVAPTAPGRFGYTFKEWKGTYTSVKADTVITAVFTANTYSIVFVDGDGNKLKTVTAEHDSVVTPPSVTAPTGFKHAGWNVKPGSGDGDSYTKVNGAATFEPVFTWANPDMPLAISVTKSVRSADSKSYYISTKVSNSKNEVLNGKLIAVIKTANDKVVATEIDAIVIEANAKNQIYDTTIGSTADAMLCEVYIVANDPENSNRTGGALSEKASSKVTREKTDSYSYWGDWSSWSETAVTATDSKEVETKTQYRYSDKQTTTSTSSTLSGWTLSGSSVSYGAWGNWSSWSTTKQTASETKGVETRTVYYYYHYCDGNGHLAPSTSYAYGKYGPHEIYSTKKLTIDRTSSTGLSIADGETKCSKGIGSYYYGGTKTQYRYRTRTKTTTYNFWKWGTASAWSDTVYTESSTRKVDKRTMYRYRNLLTGASTSSSDYIVTEDLSGKTYNISGTMKNISQNYSGKTATVMVYKDRNTDPTESQIEYVGEIVIGSGNSYDFSFIPKEAISAETGNYVVSFGIATATGLINNVEYIEAPKPQYKVTFVDMNDNIIFEQMVESGKDAKAPELPSAEGNDVRWNRAYTNITSDIIIKVELLPRKYNVIFVDWANDKIVDIQEVMYGEKADFPADCKAVGKKFIGWSIDENSVITGTTVVESVYEDLTYKVTFLNKDGSVFTTEEVTYGSAAALPEENPTADGYEFISWDTNTAWWNVTKDINVSPIFIYDKTVETPVAESEEINFISAPVILETATEDAEIYFTLDGTEPTEESFLYEDIFFVEDTTVVKAKAFKPMMNASDTVEIMIEVVPEEEMDSYIPTVSAVTNTSVYSIGDTNATICMYVNNPSGYPILSWGYTIQNTLTNEIKTYDNNAVGGITDETKGVAFKVSNLEPGTDYLYYFYIELEGYGFSGSDEYSFKTLSENPAVEPEETVKNVKINDIEVFYRDSAKITPVIEGADAENCIVKYTSSDTSRVVVNDDGVITTVHKGEATITCTVTDEYGNTVKDTCTVTVKFQWWQWIIWILIFGFLWY